MARARRAFVYSQSSASAAKASIRAVQASGAGGVAGELVVGSAGSQKPWA